MKMRVDALAGRSRRSLYPPDGIASRELDDALQAIVSEAALVASCPIALVSLVFENVQFFRAYHGLPDDLARARSTDRDVSWCQFVVRDEDAVSIEDAVCNPEVPQALVESHGIRSYVGVPVHLDGHVLGSLCVIDVEPRVFDDGLVDRLRGLARRVDARLTELATRQPTVSLGLMQSTLGPTLAALRNDLVPVHCGVDEARIAVLELQSMMANGPGMDPDRLEAAQNTLDHLADMLDLMGQANERVMDRVRAIEGLGTARLEPASVAAVVGQGEQLARPVTRNCGGIAWAPLPGGLHVDAALPLASAAVASFLGWIAERMRGRTEQPLEARVHARGDEVRVSVKNDAFDPHDAAAVYLRFRGSGLHRDRIRVEHTLPELHLVLPLRVEAEPDGPR